MTKLLGQLRLRSLFSSHPVRGFRTRKKRKYKMEAICPIMMNGCSTGIPPIQVRMATSATRAQNRNWERGRKVRPCCLEVCNRGTTINTRMENSRARTPPSLFGIDRRMAYANRKYHSGLMWGGVTNGLAGVKFSGSPKRFGEKRAKDARAVRRIMNPNTSL